MASVETARWASSLLLGILVFIGLGLIRTVVVTGIGDDVQDRKPELALALGDDSPSILAAAAAQARKAGHEAQAARLAYAALDRSPLNIAAERERGLALGALGQVAQERALLAFAGARSWRDNSVQGWLLVDDVRNKRLPDAIAHADALARRREEIWPVLFKFFEIVAADPRAANQLSNQMSLKPDWRSPFLSALAASSESTATVDRMFALVGRSKLPLDADELGAYLNRLAREGRYLDAYHALRSLGRPDWSAAVIPFNGDFDSRKGVAPFDWQVVERAGADLDFLRTPRGGAGTALRVDYDGYSSTDLLRQAMALKSGVYRVSGDAFSEVGNPARLSWEVRCIASGRVLGRATTPPAEGAAWRQFAATFSVPPEGCDGVWLVLKGDPGDRRTSIVSWYSGIRVTTARPGI